MSSILNCRKPTVNGSVALQPAPWKLNYNKNLNKQTTCNKKLEAVLKKPKSVNNFQYSNQRGQPSFNQSTNILGLKTQNNQKTVPNANVAHQLLIQLNKVKGITLQSSFYILQTAVKSFQEDFYEGRFSTFSLQNCFMDQKNKITIKKHPFFNKFITILDEAAIVKHIVEQIRKLDVPSGYHGFYFYYERAALQQLCDFKYTLSLIESYCQCSKIKIPKRIHLNQNYDINRKENNQKFYIETSQKILPAKKIRFSIQSQVDGRQSHENSFTRSQASQKPSFLKKKKCPQIQTLYNLTINPSVSEINSCRNSETKKSTASTNFNSAHQRSNSTTNSSILFGGKAICLKEKTDGNNTVFNNKTSLLENDLDQVQSLGDSLEKEKENTFKRTFSLLSKDEEKQKQKKNTEEKIFHQNNWTKTINCLFDQNQNMNQSLVSQGCFEKQQNQSYRPISPFFIPNAESFDLNE